jgi:hypothetical protein
VEFGVHATLGATDQTPSLVAGPPFMDGPPLLPTSV